MAVLTGAPRSATVRAARDSQVLRLSKRAFERLLERSPTTATHIARILVNRLRQTLHSSAAPATAGNHRDRPAARTSRSPTSRAR
jgi:CRP-like cAMP-binding protein